MTPHRIADDDDDNLLDPTGRQVIGWRRSLLQKQVKTRLRKITILFAIAFFCRSSRVHSRKAHSVMKPPANENCVVIDYPQSQFVSHDQFFFKSLMTADVSECTQKSLLQTISVCSFNSDTRLIGKRADFTPLQHLRYLPLYFTVILRYIITYKRKLCNSAVVQWQSMITVFDLISGPSTSGHVWPSGLYIVNLYCLHESHLKSLLIFKKN